MSTGVDGIRRLETYFFLSITYRARQSSSPDLLSHVQMSIGVKVKLSRVVVVTEVSGTVAECQGRHGAGLSEGINAKAKRSLMPNAPLEPLQNIVHVKPFEL
jgi:hypothetical protein